MSDLDALISRMAGHYRPHAASPATVRRRPSDISAGRANGTQTSGYGRPNTLSGYRRGGKYPNTYRPDVHAFAGGGPATTRPAFGGDVRPAGGIRVVGDVSRGDAGAMAEDNAMRALVTQRQNLAIAAGEVPAPGITRARPDARTRAA